MCAERRGEARDTHRAPGRGGKLGAGRTDGTGEPKPPEERRLAQAEKPWRKSATFPLLPPCLGGLFPHTPTLGRQPRFCVMRISVNTQQTTPSTPVPPPLVEGRTDAYFSVQGTPRVGHNRCRSPALARRPPPGRARPGGLLICICKCGAGEEGKATRCPPRRSPPAGAQIPLPPVTELVPLCRLSRNQSRHGCDT